MHTELLTVLDREHRQHIGARETAKAARKECDRLVGECERLGKERDEMRMELQGVSENKHESTMAQAGKVLEENTRMQIEEEGTVEKLREEVEKYARECDRLRTENSVLDSSLREAHAHIIQLQEMQQQRQDGERVSGGDIPELAQGQGQEEDGGRRATIEYMDDRLEKVKADFARQLELRMAVVLQEVQEHKAARESAEGMLRKLTTTEIKQSLSSPTPTCIDYDNEDGKDDKSKPGPIRRTSDNVTLVGSPPLPQPLQSKFETSFKTELKEYEDIDMNMNTNEDVNKTTNGKASVTTPSISPAGCNGNDILTCRDPVVGSGAAGDYVSKISRLQSSRSPIDIVEIEDREETARSCSPMRDPRAVRVASPLSSSSDSLAKSTMPQVTNGNDDVSAIPGLVNGKDHARTGRPGAATTTGINKPPLAISIPHPLPNRLPPLSSHPHQQRHRPEPPSSRRSFPGYSAKSTKRPRSRSPASPRGRNGEGLDSSPRVKRLRAGHEREQGRGVSTATPVSPRLPLPPPLVPPPLPPPPPPPASTSGLSPSPPPMASLTPTSMNQHKRQRQQSSWYAYSYSGGTGPVPSSTPLPPPPPLFNSESESGSGRRGQAFKRSAPELANDEKENGSLTETDTGKYQVCRYGWQQHVSSPDPTTTNSNMTKNGVADVGTKSGSEKLGGGEEPHEEQQQQRPRSRTKIEDSVPPTKLTRPGSAARSSSSASSTSPPLSSLSGEVVKSPTTTTTARCKPASGASRSAGGGGGFKVGINHMDLLYETKGEKMICRMCRTPNLKDPQTPNKVPTTFPIKAGWPELIGHCQKAHPKSFEDLEKLSPAQVAELRQRMTSSKSSIFVLPY